MCNAQSPSPRRETSLFFSVASVVVAAVEIMHWTCCVKQIFCNYVLLYGGIFALGDGFGKIFYVFSEFFFLRCSKLKWNRNFSVCAKNSTWMRERANSYRECVPSQTCFCGFHTVEEEAKDKNRSKCATKNWLTLSIWRWRHNNIKMRIRKKKENTFGNTMDPYSKI